MLNLAAAKIWLCVEPTDMRKSFDTLAARVREHLGADPQSVSWFVFRGKGGRLRVAAFDDVVERAIEPFATGRKNRLFFGSDKGGRTLATLCSLTATCELRGVNPWTYLKDVLTRLPATPADQLPTLLPDAAQ